MKCTFSGFLPTFFSKVVFASWSKGEKLVKLLHLQEGLQLYLLHKYYSLQALALSVAFFPPSVLQILGHSCVYYE